MYGCTAFPWIGPGRTSATWIVMSSRFSGCVRRIVCICARLSIWKQPTVSAFWISAKTSGSSSGTRERSICSLRVRATRSTHSSTAESIPSPSRSILRKPASAHESLSHWHIWRPAIAAGCTGTSSTRGRGELRLRIGQEAELLADALRVPAVGEARQPFEVRERQAERLPDIADRAARAVRREGGDERCVLVAVLLGDADDQLLADVAREVEVDVGHRRELAVEEAAERELVRDRIDVREPRQVADERADRRAAAAARRQHVPHRAGPTHLVRDLARKLEHLPVEQEEAGEAELVDQYELFLETPAHPPLVAVQPRVPLDEGALADAAQLHDRGLGAVGEVGIAVAELLRQVEAKPVGELDRARDGAAVVGEALEHVGGRGEHGFVVAAPLALAAVE